MKNMKNINMEEILKAMNWRYATKIYDPSKIIPGEVLHTILESARLSPSSNGVEMWKFIVVENKEIRSKLREAGYGQQKITEASCLIVITYRTDSALNLTKERIERTSKIQNEKPSDLEGLKTMLDDSVSQKIKDGSLECWIKAQAYIPLGIMIETAALLGVDGGPMEGFQPEKVDEILNLKEKNLKSVTMIALGYRGEDPAATRPKVRREFNEVIEFI
jgi:nitroreductase